MSNEFTKQLMVRPGKKVKLSKYDPEDALGWKKGHETNVSLKKTLATLDRLQSLLYADHKSALLIVLQGMDGSGKDGTIRHVMSGVNPQGCQVTSFKVPTAEEAAHDFLWRVHHAVPEVGDIGVFNRSHYEDVLIVRVHKLVPKEVWSQRYDEINDFESMLAENNVKILKFFLHISKEEQKKRLLKRIDDQNHQWKLSEADFHERRFWADYMAAYEDALTKCTTDAAPWFIIPSNKKWFRNLAVSHIIAETLENMHMRFPVPTIDVSKLKFS